MSRQLSYLIACAETTQQDLEPYHFQIGHAFNEENTLLDALISSLVFSFTPTVVRSGVFLHIKILNPSILLGVNPPAADILVGTFTESFSVAGGYIASNKTHKTLVDRLR